MCNYMLHGISQGTHLLPTISVPSVAIKHIAEENNDPWVLNQTKQHIQNNLSTTSTPLPIVNNQH